jgi:hypothetical protein
MVEESGLCFTAAKENAVFPWESWGSLVSSCQKNQSWVLGLFGSFERKVRKQEFILDWMLSESKENSMTGCLNTSYSQGGQ